MSHLSILIPVDGSADSLFACKIAADISAAIPGKEVLHLLHCVESIPNLVGGEERKKLLEEHEEKAEFIFAKCRKELDRSGNPCQTHIRYGAPGATIAEVAKEMNCTIIVMGTRGMNDLKSLVLGSVSHDVLQHSKIPVLLAKKPTE